MPRPPRNGVAQISLTIPLTTPRLPPQRTAGSFIGIATLIDGPVADIGMMADLFRTPLLTQPILHKLPSLSPHLSGIDGFTPTDLPMRCFWTEAKPAITPQFPADGGGIVAEQSSNLFLRMPGGL